MGKSKEIIPTSVETVKPKIAGVESAEEPTVEAVEQPTEMNWEYFNIKDNNLETLVGYKDLSEGQQALVLENFKQLMLGWMYEEGYRRHEEGKKTATVLGSNFLGKVWKGITKNLDIASKSKIAVGELRKAGFESHKPLLEQLVSAAKAGPEVKIGKDKKLEMQYAQPKSSPGVKLSKKKQAEQQELVNSFNVIATRFAGLPYDFSLATAGKKQQAEYLTLRVEYEAAKQQLLKLKEAQIGQEKALLAVNEIDGQVQQNQFLNSHPEVEKKIQEIENDGLWKRAMANVATERGLYMAGGVTARSVTVSLIGAIGLPVAAAVSGGVFSYRRAKAGLKEHDIMARKGVADETAQARNVADARSVIRVEGKEGEAEKEIPAGLIVKLDEQMKAIEKEKDPLEQRKQVNSLKIRIQFTKGKIEQGLVNFGTAEVRLKNQLDLIQKLSEAGVVVQNKQEVGKLQAEDLEVLTPEDCTKLKELNAKMDRRNELLKKQKDKALTKDEEAELNVLPELKPEEQAVLKFLEQRAQKDRIISGESLEKRLASYLTYKETKISKERTKHLVKQAAIGAGIGATFAAAGYGIRWLYDTYIVAPKQLPVGGRLGKINTDNNATTDNVAKATAADNAAKLGGSSDNVVVKPSAIDNVVPGSGRPGAGAAAAASTEKFAEPPAELSLEKLKESGALVGRGKGVEHVFKNQLVEDPKSYGFKGDVDDSAAVGKWAGSRAHQLAIEKGYVNTESGLEVRVKGADQTAYVLETNKDGDIRVAEYHQGSGGKFELTDTHKEGEIQFEGKEHNEYEYLDKTHQHNHELVDQPSEAKIKNSEQQIKAAVDQIRSKHVPNGAAEAGSLGFKSEQAKVMAYFLNQRVVGPNGEVTKRIDLFGTGSRNLAEFVRVVDDSLKLKFIETHESLFNYQQPESFKNFFNISKQIGIDYHNQSYIDSFNSMPAELKADEISGAGYLKIFNSSDLEVQKGGVRELLGLGQNSAVSFKSVERLPTGVLLFKGLTIDDGQNKFNLLISDEKVGIKKPTWIGTDWLAGEGGVKGGKPINDLNLSSLRKLSGQITGIEEIKRISSEQLEQVGKGPHDEFGRQLDAAQSDHVHAEEVISSANSKLEATNSATAEQFAVKTAPITEETITDKFSEMIKNMGGFNGRLPNEQALGLVGLVQYNNYSPKQLGEFLSNEFGSGNSVKKEIDRIVDNLEAVKAGQMSGTVGKMRIESALNILEKLKK